MDNQLTARKRRCLSNALTQDHDGYQSMKELDRIRQAKNFTIDDVNQAILVALEIGGRGYDFDKAYQQMVIKGVRSQLAMRVLNLIPIMAGRVLMKATRMKPRLSHYYVLHHENGARSDVRFESCQIAKTIHQKIVAMPGLESQLGVDGCEMLALNDALRRLGRDPDPAAVANIQILPPEMGGEQLRIHGGTVGGEVDDLILNDEWMSIRCVCGTTLKVPLTTVGTVITSSCCQTALKVKARVIPIQATIPPPITIVSSAATMIDCQCGQKLQISDPTPGKMFRCPKCSWQFKLGSE